MKDALGLMVTDFGNMQIRPETLRAYERIARGRAKPGGALAQRRAQEALFKDASGIARYFFLMKGDIPVLL